VYILEQNGIELDNINISTDGNVTIFNVADYNFLQRILEIDADCCAISMVVNKMLRETEIEMKEYAVKHGLSTSDHIRYSIFYRSMTLGLITGAAGIMCGYFESRIPGAFFTRLSVILSSDHPINAIRFYKMQMTVF
jgi:hypothetical protein